MGWDQSATNIIAEEPKYFNFKTIKVSLADLEVQLRALEKF